MCIVCIEMAKGKMTPLEAYRALSEIAMDPKQKEHVEEVIEKIIEKEKKSSQASSRKAVQGLSP